MIIHLQAYTHTYFRMYNIILHISVTEPNITNLFEVASIFPPECVTLDFGFHIHAYPIRLEANFYSILFQQFAAHSDFWFGESVKQHSKFWTNPLHRLKTREENREALRSFQFTMVNEKSLDSCTNDRSVASTFHTSTQPQAQKHGLIYHWEVCQAIFSTESGEYSVFYILFCHF